MGMGTLQCLRLRYHGSIPMVHWHCWRSGVKLACRDLRKSHIQGALIALPMALSIAAMVGVRGAADIARQALQGDARAFLAADLCADTREPINQEQVDALDRMQIGRASCRERV